MRLRALIPAVLLIFAGSPALAQNCTSIPNQLTNGTTADATKVMGDFTYLSGCTASMASPNFTGNVGIGTTSPADTLTVYGTGNGTQVLVASNANNSEINLQNTGTGGQTWDLSSANANSWLGSGDFYIGGQFYNNLVIGAQASGSPGFIALGHNITASSGAITAADIYINPSGNVGIGTTTPNGPLSLYSSSGTASLDLQSGSNARYWITQPSSNILAIGGNGGTAPSSGVININASSQVGVDTAAPALTFWVNGSAGGTQSWNGSSDRRLKKNIRPIEGALELVSQINGVRYSWRTPQERAVGKALDLPVSEPQVGFIAQDLQKVLPEAVSVGSGREKVLSVAESKVVPVLVEAIKELSKRNAALAANNATLNATVGKIWSDAAQMGRDNTLLHAELTSVERRLSSLESAARNRTRVHEASR